MESLDCWDLGFESCREHLCSSVVFVESCAGSCLCNGLIAPSEECHRVCVTYLCDLETLTKRRSRPELRFCFTEGHNTLQTLRITKLLIK